MLNTNAPEFVPRAVQGGPLVNARDTINPTTGRPLMYNMYFLAPHGRSNGRDDPWYPNVQQLGPLLPGGQVLPTLDPRALATGVCESLLQGKNSHAPTQQPYTWAAIWNLPTNMDEQGMRSELDYIDFLPETSLKSMDWMVHSCWVTANFRS